MEFINKSSENCLKMVLIFSFCYMFFPLKTFALSIDPAQSFDTSCAGAFSLSSAVNTGWSIASNSAVTQYTIVNGSGDAINDPYDCSPSLYSVFYCSTNNPTNANAITITYVDPSPSAPTTYVKFDFYDSSGSNRSFTMIVNAVSGDVATSFPDDVMPDCYQSAPVTTGNTGTSTEWETGYVQLLGPGANSDITSSDLIKSVEITFTGDSEMTSASFGGNPMYLDHLRGEEILSCWTPTPTPTSTITATPTPTGSATPTVTWTGTNTPAYTATVTNTNTATMTNTSTVTLTPTITQTPVYTATMTHTSTITSTPFNTMTPTITLTLTPAPCQIEVYPNPMDFTISHNLSNADGVCTAANGQCMIFSCVPLGSTIKIYTVSLALVRILSPQSIVSVPNLPAGVGLVPWDGTNGNEQYVASGLYFYVVNGPGGNTFGKFAISKSHYGP